MTESALNGPDLRSLRAGEGFTAFFVVRKKELKTKKDGTPFLLFEFGDHSGRMPATLWEGVQAVHAAVRAGDTVKVKGTVMEYKDALQIAIEKIRKTEPPDGVDPKMFLRSEGLDLDGQFRALMDEMALIANPDVRRLMDAVFAENGTSERFREAPGGKLWHHAYLGGLVQHTAAVLAICGRAAASHPKVDRDVLAAGAVLHDIGKLEEYEFHRGFIDYTDRGRLFGHVVLGAQRVTKTIGEISADGPFPEELHRRIVHMILSHHGKLEQGAPVPPMTPEAMILHHADELDSKVNALDQIIEKEKTGESRWSRYVQLLDRFIYLGE